MSLPETIQHMYHELALRYERQKEMRLRDVFYLLVADVAYASGRGDDAERLHHTMLEANPNSLLRPFATFAAALQSLDIQDYLADLRRQFPPEDAEKLLLKVRANPLGSSTGQRTLSQRDTQEVNPPTARTVNMPPPSNIPPRKKSPYEQTSAPPPPATTDESPWTATLTVFWFFLLMLTGLGLAIWSLARPLWDPA